MSELINEKSLYRQGFEAGLELPIIEDAEKEYNLHLEKIDTWQFKDQAEYLLGLRDGRMENYFKFIASKVNVWAAGKSDASMLSLLYTINKVLFRYGIALE